MFNKNGVDIESLETNKGSAGLPFFHAKLVNMAKLNKMNTQKNLKICFFNAD